MKKAVFFFTGLLVLSSFTVKTSVRAISEFDTDYSVEYRIDSRGLARVTQKITLTNNFSNIYPREYHLEIGDQAQSISAWDDKGSILSSVDQGEKSTRIRLKFNQEPVGKGGTIIFNINYQLPNFAIRKGQVWEIILPKISNIESIRSYETSLLISPALGRLSYASIKPKRQSELGSQSSITFSKDQLSGGAVLLAFGDFQIFDFSLDYGLKNSTDQKEIRRVAIPPETNYQVIYYSQISPRPEYVELDTNGNWLASYILYPQETKQITVSGQAKILAGPKTDHFYNQKESLDLFLQPDKYWETDYPQIISLAKELKTPRAIYRYVVDTLSYDSDSLKNSPSRKGAIQALLSPDKSVCTEFTDLFITIARAANIPAREIEGFAFTNNPAIKPLSLKIDVLHAWPEYWDSNRQSWVQVDPTWENTTGGVDYFDYFDLNHFTFVIHGDQSQFPLPPGSYPTTNGQKTVRVDFSRQLPKEVSSEEPKINLEYENTSQNSLLTLQNKEAKIIINNTSLAPIKNLKVVYIGYQMSFLGKPISLPFWNIGSAENAGHKTELIPPLGKEELTITKFPRWIEWLFSPRYQFDVSGENIDSGNSNIITLSP